MVFFQIGIRERSVTKTEPLVDIAQHSQSRKNYINNVYIQTGCGLTKLQGDCRLTLLKPRGFTMSNNRLIGSEF